MRGGNSGFDNFTNFKHVSANILDGKFNSNWQIDGAPKENKNKFIKYFQSTNIDQLREQMAGSTRIRGNTLGLIGLGRVGTAVVNSPIYILFYLFLFLGNSRKSIRFSPSFLWPKFASGYKEKCHLIFHEFRSTKCTWNGIDIHFDRITCQIRLHFIALPFGTRKSTFD